MDLNRPVDGRFNEKGAAGGGGGARYLLTGVVLGVALLTDASGTRYGFRTSVEADEA